ncbi:MAG: serine hydrolase [Verrucomicrobiales bacterium]|nr:serine hydrolase [Verrucomicrobiales bacterium]
MIRFTQTVTLFLLAFIATGRAEDNGKRAVRDEIKAVIREGHYPGISILLIHKGEVIMREAHGVVNIDTEEPFAVDQLCWLASTGKMFTATLMAKLVDEGVLSFDDPIADTFPEFSKIKFRDGGASPKRPILLRHALSHTSGLPGNQWMKQNGITEEDPKYRSYFFAKTPVEFIDGCIRMGLAVEPGSRMLYGRPIDLSACVAEKLTGKPFTRLMEEKVFAPLGLENTTIQPTKADLDKLAPLYQSDTSGVFEPDNFGLEVAERQANRLSTAGGGVYSTLDDLGVLMQLHLNHGKHNGVQLIEAETLRKLYQPQPGTNGRYGLAFQIMKNTINGESTLYNHPGYSGPVAWFDFERQLAGVLLMQSNTVGRGKHHQRILDRIHEMIPTASNSAAAPPTPQPVSPDKETLATHQFKLIFDSPFNDPKLIGPQSPLWRRESMIGSNNSGQHRQAPARRHAAWYDKYFEKTAFIRDGVLVQRGFVADSDMPGFVSRDAGDAPRNYAYTDPDPRDKSKGEVNFADFEIHTSWFDTFALKSVDGKQVPVLPTDTLVESKDYWGQPGKTDTRSPDITFSPGTYFEIEVNFEDMKALSHRHSFWLMPASANSAYDSDPANGVEIDIYEHELAREPGTPVGDGPNLNEGLLMKCIGGSTNPPSTVNELRKDGKTLILVPGINRGWHQIGLLWTEEKLVWFVDGKACVKDTGLVPQVDMFMILSREANTGATKSDEPHSLKMDGERIPHDAGLFGRNVATPENRNLIKAGEDEVKVRYVRAWKIAE